MKHFEEIESYLWGKMTEEEVANFEQKIVADLDLAIEVETQRLELKAIEQMEEDLLLVKMKGWREEAQRSDQLGSSQTSIAPSLTESAKENGGAIIRKLTPRRFVLWALAAAACAALFIVIEYIRSPDIPKLIVANAENPISTLKSTELVVMPADSLSTKFEIAYEALKSGNYDLSFRSFDEIAKSTLTNDKLREAAEFNYALAVLGKEDKAKAIELLEIIAGNMPDSPDYHRYRIKAKKLLADLKRFR
jgi:TolA-binding protein